MARSNRRRVRLKPPAPPRSDRPSPLGRGGRRANWLSPQTTSCSPAGEADAWVDKSYQQIDRNIGDKERRCDDEHRANDSVEVLVQDDLDAVARKARPAEHVFHQERIAKQRREIETEDRED